MDPLLLFVMLNANCLRSSPILIFGHLLQFLAVGKYFLDDYRMNRLLFRFVTLLILIVMLLSFVAPSSPAHAEGADGYVPDEVVLKLRLSTDLTSIASDYA